MESIVKAWFLVLSIDGQVTIVEVPELETCETLGTIAVAQARKTAPEGELPKVSYVCHGQM